MYFYYFYVVQSVCRNVIEFVVKDRHIIVSFVCEHTLFVLHHVQNSKQRLHVWIPADLVQSIEEVELKASWFERKWVSAAV